MAIVIGGTCRNCRFSEPVSKRWEYREALVGFPLVCSRAEMDDGKPEDPTTKAFSQDGSDYRASLMVSDDFGCVMWEKGDG